MASAKPKSKTAKADERNPKIGDKAPAFALAADGGRKLALSAFKGRKVVLYFYPKDDTSGCTQEAIDFTAALKDFAKVGATVIGLSRDSVERHDKFKAKHGLGVDLVSDPEGKVCADYGVWVEKSLYGRKFMGIERSTFLIDGSGKVAQVWRKVSITNHVREVLEATKAL